MRPYNHCMESYSLGERGQAIYAVSEPGYGAVWATWGERGTAAHLVSEGGGGAQSVFFVNGPPGMVHSLPGYLPPPPRDWTPEYLLLLLQ